MEARLDRHPRYRRVRQVGLQGQPARAVVERYVQPALGPRIDQPATHRVLGHHVDERQGGAGECIGDALPRLAVVRRLVDVRREVVQLVQVHREIGGPGVEVRRLDVGDLAPRRQLGEVARHIRPLPAAVACDVHQAVVRARPDDASLERRFGDGEQGRTVERHEVIGRDAARGLLVGRVVTSKIGADHLPAGAAIGRQVHDLASDVDPGVIVGRQRDREGPVPAVFEVGRPPAVARLGPHAHVAGVIGARVVHLEPAVVAARPHCHVVDGVGDREAALAAADVSPLSFGDAPGEPAARHPVGAAVLAVAVDVVGHAGVRVHVVHLGDRQHHARVALAAVQREARAAVVGDQDTVGVQGVDPDVVVVPAGREGTAGERLAAVARHAEPHRDEVETLLVVGRDGETHVIRSALRHVVIAAHDAPGGTAIIAAIQRRVLIFDQRVDGVGIGGGDRDSDLADDVIRRRETVARQALPRDPAVA